MPFYFTCPYCMNKTLVSENLSGQSGPCVNCGKTVTIPAAPAPRRADIAPVEDSRTPQYIPRKPLVSRTLVRMGIYMLALVPLAIAAFWFGQPVVLKLKANRDINICKQNLQQIARALNNYAADYGTYPPAVTYDASGKKAMHSWRVLILPYLGQQKLYNTYDMSKPWDAPENTHMQAQIPSVYISPANTSVAIGEASYMLVTGPGTLFPPNAAPGSPKLVPDGASDTILVVETNNRNTSWTEPVDLDVTTLPPRLGMLGGIGGSHSQGATVVFVDGKAVFLPGDASKPVVDGLITPAGGESVSGSWYK